MDPVANLQRQREISDELMRRSDCDGPDAIIEPDLVYELCELVQALDGWRQRGGFDPYRAAA